MKINLLRRLPKDTFVYVEDYLRYELFHYDKNLTKFSKSLRLDLRNVSRYKQGKRAIPLRLFLKLMKRNNLLLERFQNKIMLKSGKNGTLIKIGPYLKLNEEWVYISELIRGDGHLNKNLCGITFVNNEEKLIDFVKNFFLKHSLPKNSLYLYKKLNTYFLVIRSKLFLLIFNKFFDIPIGRKGEMRIPDFIKNEEQFSLAFLRGFFDTEGSVTKNKPIRITLSSNSKMYITECQDLLKRFNIFAKLYRNTNGVFSLCIGKKRNALRFLNDVKPLHPKRKTKLEKVLNEYTFEDVSSHILGMDILKILKNNKVLKRSQISKLLNKDINSLNLKYLRDKKFIMVVDKIITNKGGWFLYSITEKGRNHLKRQF